MGFIGFTACLLNIVGYQLGEATKIAFLENFDLFASFMYQIIIFGDVPNIFECIGCVLVIIAAILPLIEQIRLYRSGIHEIEYDEVALTENDQSDTTDIDIERNLE